MTLLTVAFGLSSGDAQAQVPVAAPLRPAASTESHITTESSRVLPAWTPSAALVTAHDQWLAPASDAQTLPTVRSRTTSHLLVGFGILDWAEIDVGLPLVLYQQGDVPPTSNATGADDVATLEPSALGDVRTTAKGTIIRTPGRGFGAGVGFDILWPTGSTAAMSTEGSPTYTPWLYGENRTIRGIESAVNLGYAVRRDAMIGNYAVSDAFVYRLAGRVPFGRELALAGVAELDGSIGIADAASSPLVARAGVRWRMRSGIVLGLYGGGAIVSGFNVPPVHGLLSVGYVPPHRVGKERAFAGSPRPSTVSLARRYERAVALARPPEPEAPVDPRDPDRDGVLAAADACPSVPEDLDKFEDADGCPEWDNDRDGLRDALDLCPSEPELINGYADWDGCPDIRLADGSGRSSSRFDPRQIYPKVVFADDSAELSPESIAALTHFAELVRLNAWMGQVELRIEVHADTDDLRTLALARDRAASVTSFLERSGIDAWRMHVGQPAVVPAERDEHLRLAIQGTSSGLRPLAPPPPVLDRLLAEAADEARADEQRKLAASVSTPHGARVDPKGAEIMAQGPEDGGKTTPPGAAPKVPAGGPKVPPPMEGPARKPHDAGTGAKSSSTDKSKSTNSRSPAPAGKSKPKTKPKSGEESTPISGKLLDMLHRDQPHTPP